MKWCYTTIECLNTATDEELDHSDIEQVALQMLMQENVTNVNARKYPHKF